MAFDPSVIKTFVPTGFNPEEVIESLPGAKLGDQINQAVSNFNIDNAKVYLASATGLGDIGTSISDFNLEPEFSGSLPFNGDSTISVGVGEQNASITPSNKSLSKYDFSSHTYPSDLFSSDNRWGGMYVVFNINIQEDSKLAKDKNTITIPDDEANKGKGSAITQQSVTGEDFAIKMGALGGIAAGIGGTVLNMTGLGGTNLAPGIFKSVAVGGVIGGITAAASEGNLGKDGIIDFTVDALSKNITRQTKRLKTSIALYCPPDISVKYGMQWADDDTAILSAVLNTGVDDLKNALMGSGAESKTGNSNAIQGLILKMGNAATPSGTSALLGVAPNPKKEQMFNGVDFRTHQFNYRFWIRNESDHQNVRNIIREFKYHMHPEFKNGNDYIFLYPSEFDIQFYYKDKPSDELPKYTTCVLTDLNTNYTPQGVLNLLNGGKIAEISLNLVFRELSILTKEDIEDGY